MSHYFSEHPDTAFSPVALEVELRGEPFHVTSAGGVFSGRGVDKGTAVLLRRVPDPRVTAGIALDIGSGWGPITLALASALRAQRDAEVWAVDVNERARDLTARNARANGLDRVRVFAPDAALDELGDRTISLIWSNPPVRIGKDALHGLLLTWLPRLDEDGEAFLVVQRNLGSDSLAAWLTEQGFPTEKFASQKGFRVLRTVRG